MKKKKESKGNVEKKDNIEDGRRKFIKAVPFVAASPLVFSKNSKENIKFKEVKDYITPKDHDKIEISLKPLEDAFEKRRNIKAYTFRALTSSILELVKIDKQDFYKFAEGRLDRVGNYISIAHISEKTEFLENLLELRNENSIKISKKLDILNYLEKSEKELLKIVGKFLISYRNVVRSVENYFKNKNTFPLLCKNIDFLKSEYKKLINNYGSLTNIVIEVGLHPADNNNSIKPFSGYVIAGDLDNRINTNRMIVCDTESLCCQTNMTCESDTIDCGLFDNCQNDGCGFADDDSPCTFYDGGGCLCNIEDT